MLKTLVFAAALYASLWSGEPAKFLFGEELYPGELRIWGVLARTAILLLYKQMVQIPAAATMTTTLAVWALILLYAVASIGLALPVQMESAIAALVFATVLFGRDASRSSSAKPTKAGDFSTPKSHASLESTTIWTSATRSQNREQHRRGRGTRERSKSPAHSTATTMLADEPPHVRVLQSQQVSNAKQQARLEQDQRVQAVVARLKKPH